MIGDPGIYPQVCRWGPRKPSAAYGSVNVETMRIGPDTPSAHNVVAGWLGVEIPPMPKHRNKSRAGYRKTPARRQRGHSLIGQAPKTERRQPQLF